MKILWTANFALLVSLATVSQASILTFDTGQGNNADLSLTFGSNLSADIAGANISNGTTPDIGLAWAPSPNVWEVHSAASFSSVGDGKVVQLDVNGGEPDPTVTFSVDDGWRLGLNSLVIGHASDQTEPANAWTLSISEVGGGEVFTHTTAALDASDTEDVTFSFTGKEGVHYVLKFDDGGADHFRGAIDNLSFNQVDASNLIINPGNDLALVGGEIAGWDEVVGTTWTQRSIQPNPESGSAYFNPGAGANHELAQTIDVSSYGGTIDLGIQQFDFTGYVSGWSNNATTNSDLDTAQIIVEFWDDYNTGSLLDFYDSGADTYNYLQLANATGSQWAQLTDSRLAPSGTRDIRIRLIAKRFNGNNDDGFFDSLELTTFTLPIPEPSALTLLALGLLGLLACGRRRRR